MDVSTLDVIYCPDKNSSSLISVSGDTPEEPVVSSVSGSIYERRLIEKYLGEYGTDPVNGQPLSKDQLIDIKGIAS